MTLSHLITQKYSGGFLALELFSPRSWRSLGDTRVSCRAQQEGCLPRMCVGIKHRVSPLIRVHSQTLSAIPLRFLCAWDPLDPPSLIASEGSICEAEEIYHTSTAFLSFQTAEGEA